MGKYSDFPSQYRKWYQLKSAICRRKWDDEHSASTQQISRLYANYAESL